MPYHITNTASVGKSYEADNGKRIRFEPKERKELSTLPPRVDEDSLGDVAGWKIAEVAKPDTNEEEGDS